MPGRQDAWRAGVCLVITAFTCCSAALANQFDSQQPPVLNFGPPKHLYYNVGDKESLSCRATANPSPRYEWVKNGVALQNSSEIIIINGETSTLHLIKPTEKTEGHYQCRATNQYGKGVSNISFVQRSVFRRIHNNKPLVLTAREGDRLNLTCNHTYSIPHATFRWYANITSNNRRGDRVPESDRVTVDEDGSLHIANLLLSDAPNVTRYKCKSFNRITNSYIDGSYVDLKVEPEKGQRMVSVIAHTPTPHVALIGEETRLQCFFAGAPTPTIKWRKKGGYSARKRVKKQRNGTELVIKNTQPEDAGMYRCKGSNVIGTDVIIINVSVQGAPRLRSPLAKLRVPAGDRAKFVCDVTGIPTPSVRWLINGLPIQENQTLWNATGNVVYYNPVMLGDMFGVSCNASNEHGYVVSGGFLKGIERPPTTTTTTTTTTPNVNTTIQLTTTTSSTPQNIVISQYSPTKRLSTETLLSTVPNASTEVYTHVQGTDHESAHGQEKQTQDSNRAVAAASIIPILLFFLLIAFGLYYCFKRRKPKSYSVAENEMKRGLKADLPPDIVQDQEIRHSLPRTGSRDSGIDGDGFSKLEDQEAEERVHIMDENYM